MRRIHYGDVAALARALMCLQPEARAAQCLRMIREAQCAEAHRRETGQAHPLWGSGSLMEVARRRVMAGEPGFEDAQYCAALRLVLDCLQETAIRQRQH